MVQGEVIRAHVSMYLCSATWIYIIIPPPLSFKKEDSGVVRSGPIPAPKERGLCCLKSGETRETAPPPPRNCHGYTFMVPGPFPLFALGGNVAL